MKEYHVDTQNTRKLLHEALLLAAFVAFSVFTFTSSYVQCQSSLKFGYDCLNRTLFDGRPKSVVFFLSTPILLFLFFYQLIAKKVGRLKTISAHVTNRKEVINKNRWGVEQSRSYYIKIPGSLFDLKITYEIYEHVHLGNFVEVLYNPFTSEVVRLKTEEQDEAKARVEKELQRYK